MNEQSPVYRWEVAGKPVRVELSLAAAQRIAAEAERGMRGAERTVEVGGILLGSVESGEPHVVSVRSAEPVSCEYAYGPTFILTERDEQRLAAEVARWQSADAGLAPVGFYRSHMRGNISLSEQDLWLFATHFSAPFHVALIVGPRPDKPPCGGFFFWENGTIKSDSTYKEFPLAPGDCGKGNGQQAGPPQETQERSDDLPLPELPSTPEAAHRALRVRIPGLANPGILAAVAGGLLLGGGLLGFAAGRLWRVPPAAPSAPPYTLSLAVKEYGENLHLTWNRRAPAIEKAMRGFLYISDGQSAKPPVELGQDQLRKGSVIYRRTSPEVKMRLEVFVNDRDSVAEVWTPRNR